MKKIYTFTISQRGEKVAGDIRTLAYMLYGELYNYYGDDTIPLNINKYIVCNNLYDDGRMDSDNYDDGFINYEPFLLGDNSFGFTVLDEMISDEVIKELLDYVQTLLRFNYRIDIDSNTYVSNGRDDESERPKAINFLEKKLGLNPSRKIGFFRRFLPCSGYRSYGNCYRRY